MHHDAKLYVGAVVTPGLEGTVEIAKRDFSEEAERAKVDAEDRRWGVGKGTSGGEQGSVASEDDNQIWLMPRKIGTFDGIRGVNVGGTVGIEQIAIVMRIEPLEKITQDAGEFRLLGLGDDGGLEH
jgi:hypothetical protein